MRAYIVWEPMISSDTREWAETETSEFRDKRLRYFWDGNRLTGHEFQRVLGTNRVAWDVYLLYGKVSRWEDAPVPPEFWMHQLNGESGAPRLDGSVFEVRTTELLGRQQ